MDRFPFYEGRSLWIGNKTGLPIGTNCGDGWYEIIYNMCENIETELKKFPSFDFYFMDIKEKYGILSVYPSPIPDSSKIYDYILEAEAKSRCVCEACGSQNNVSLHNSSGWYKTRCFSCFIQGY